jgi:uncharacterized SAM-binding protein YcdF (DUF218 family)
VLTGDEDRISTGMRLMQEGRANRLLISGVNQGTRIPTELKRYARGSDTLVKCCVDIGREALNTSGNANEARHWAEMRGYRSLFVVTSSYHLPRSLIEFQRAIPGMQLIGHPSKAGRNVHLETWWRHAPTLRLLGIEYVKLLGAGARLGVARLLDGRNGSAPAPSVPQRAPPKKDESTHKVGEVR